MCRVYSVASRDSGYLTKPTTFYAKGSFLMETQEIFIMAETAEDAQRVMDLNGASPHKDFWRERREIVEFLARQTHVTVDRFDVSLQGQEGTIKVDGHEIKGVQRLVITLEACKLPHIVMELWSKAGEQP